MRWGILGLLFLLAACQGGMPIKKSTTLFSLDAEDVNILPFKAPLKRYKIVLRDIEEDILELNGRPICRSETLSIQQFLERDFALKSGLSKRPPHLTVIVYAPHHRGHLERAAILFKINSIEYSKERDEMVFDATAMSEIKSYMIGHPMKIADFLIESSGF